MQSNQTDTVNSTRQLTPEAFHADAPADFTEGRYLVIVPTAQWQPWMEAPRARTDAQPLT